jgi:hypothetical protein
MLALRFVKVVSVLFVFAGTIGAVLPWDMPHRVRRMFAFRIAAPGFLATWVSGFLLAGIAGHPLLSIWVIGSLVASLTALHGVLYSAGKDGRASTRVCVLTLTALLATVALMVWRPVSF